VHNFDGVIAQRFAIIEEGKTIAKSQIGEPARIEQAVAEGAIKRHRAKQVQRAVVGTQRRGLQQRRDQDQAGEQQ